MEHLPSIATIERSNVAQTRGHAFEISGRGPVSVVFETGLGADSHEWANVKSAINTCTFTYDRAGRGASERASGVRDAHALVDELHQLLKATKVAPPHILVGHSLGGLLMRVFAHRYPEDVAGLVLVDSMHEDQFELIGAAFPAPTPSEPAQLASLRSFWTGGWRSLDSTEERLDLSAIIEQGRAVTDLGDLPMRVITAGTFIHPALASPDDGERLQLLWEILQARLLRLSTGAQQKFALDCSHFVQREAPSVIAEAVLDLVRYSNRC
jgi:Predicted hydrolases or acyltransferases (alpha/beta hydrolase superfamily)